MRVRFQITTLRVLLIGVLFVSSSGCVVVQYAIGDEGTDIESVQAGVSREHAEGILGKPIREWHSAIGTHFCTYQYDGGRPPTLLGAGFMFLMDLILLGAFEVANLFSEKFQETLHNDGRVSARIVVSYDSEDRVLGLFGEFDELPADGRASCANNKLQNTPADIVK